MDHDQWLEERKKGIGGSEAAAIMGLDPGRSALAIYLDKIGEGVPVAENERIHWGTMLEEQISLEYERRNGRVVWYNKDQTPKIHKEHSWWRCTLDADSHDLVRGYGVIECKNIDYSEFKRSWSDTTVPDKYLLQLMHNIGVTGYSWGALCVLVGGNTWKCYEYERDDDLIDSIFEHERRFWFDHVMKRVPPDPQGSSLEVLAHMYRKANGQEISIDGPEIGESIRKYLSFKRDREEAEAIENRCKAEIQARMGEASRGVYMDPEWHEAYAISWTEVKGRTGFDVKSFERDHPDLYAQYMKPGASYRRFSVVEKNYEDLAAKIGQTKLKEVA